MDRNTNIAANKTNEEFIADFVKTINNTLPEEGAAAVKLVQAKEKGLLFSKYGIEKDIESSDENILDSAEFSMSRIVEGKNYILADPDVLSGEKTADKGTFYLYSEFPVQNMRNSQKAEKMSFDKLIDFVNNDDNSIRKPAKPKLGFWGTLRNAFSFVFGKPEGQKKYEREMEVYKVSKLHVLEEKFNFKVPEYNKDLLDENVAFVYKNTGKVHTPEMAGKIVARAVQLGKAKAVIGTFKNNGNIHVAKGAEYLEEIISNRGEDVKEANRTVVNFINTAGADILGGRPNTGLSKNFIEDFSRICENIGLVKDELDLGNIDDAAMKSHYCECIDEVNVLMRGPYAKIAARNAAKENAAVQEQKKVENDVKSVKEELIKEDPKKEELIKEEPKNAEPAKEELIKEEPEKNTVKEKPHKPEELYGKGASLTIQKFIESKDEEIANGAKVIDEFMKNNPEIGQTQILKEFLSKSGSIMNKEPGSAKSNYYKVIIEDACRSINERIGGDPENAAKVLKEMNVKAAVGTFIPTNYEKEADEAGKKIEEFNKQSNVFTK